MKTITAIFAALCISTYWISAQTASSSSPTATGQAPPIDTPWAVAKCDGSSRVWQRTTYEITPDGGQIPHTHEYIELASGLNYLSKGQWVESKEQIDILPDGTAAATNLQSPVYFPSDIASGAIRLITPEGVQLQNGPAFLDFDDGTNIVLIGVTTNSVGELISSNQVLYPDIFRGSGFRVDLLCTVRKSGLESDLVFREQIPDPTSLGLGANARLQLLTEWYGTPEPAQMIGAQSPADGLTDTTLRFGSTIFGRGKAFVIGTSNAQGQASAPKSQIPVYKSWLHLDGRQFLMEEVPYDRMAPQLEQLPTPVSTAESMNSAHSMLYKTSATRRLPPPRVAQANANSGIQLAKTDLGQQRGVVLDYVTISSYTNDLIFQGDTTYYVSDYVFLGRTNVIEGGSVIKFSRDGSIECFGSLTCATSPYRPAVLTAIDDDTVGEPISGSTGNPSGTYAGIAIGMDYAIPGPFQYLRIAYAYTGLGVMSPAVVSHCQFINTGSAVVCANNSAPINVNNSLFWNVGTIFDCWYGIYYSANAVNVTAHDVGTLVSSGVTLAITNSLFVCVTNWGSSFTGDHNATNSSDVGIFQVVGAGGHYLATNSPSRNAGTTNIDPALLAELAAKTTYPPVVYSNRTISANTILSPQAQRDTDTPDLGYHYDPFDYVFGGTEAQSNITFTAGTAVGWYDNQSGPGYGIKVDKGATVAFTGTATAPCWFARYDTAQEGGNGNWTLRGYLAGLTSNNSNQGYSSDASQVVAQFTKFSSRPYDDSAFRDLTGFFVIRASNCEFWTLGCGGYDVSLNYTNCLFFRVPPGEEDSLTNSSFTMRNCTVIGGNPNALGIIHDYGASWPVWITDCVFDGTTFYIDKGGNTNLFYCDYNAFLTNANRSVIGGSHDVTNLISFNWQSSWLGDYYQPTDSPLIDKGSVTADQVGLYHYTDQISGIKEGFSTVDIGYHYVATRTLDTVWVEDAVPAGAYEETTWSWVSANPGPFSGTLALQSDINPGYSEHYFFEATDVLVVDTNDTLVAYVFLDPANTPSGVMLQWWSMDYRYAVAYWGGDLWGGGTYMGPLPSSGGWVRLEIPASQVGLEGAVLNGMNFGVYGGRATWDHVGKANLAWDTNGDGIPDYIEDANGNGLVDSGEIGWNIVGDLGLKVQITRPRNGSILP